MKHNAKKIFEGCPLEHRNYESCFKCPEHGFCNAKKRAILRENRLKTMISMTCILLILMLIAFVVSILITNRNEDDIEDNTSDMNENQSEVYNEHEAKLSADGPSEVYYYEVSEEEKLMIAKLVWAEARGESYVGKVAVAAVVLNRYRFDENEWDFENDSIESVILQKNQFASISNVTMQDLEEYPDCMPAVEDACKGYDPTRTTFKDGALYFYNPKYVTGKQKEIREYIKVMTIGNHNFHYDFEKVVEE